MKFRTFNLNLQTILFIAVATDEIFGAYNKATKMFVYNKPHINGNTLVEMRKILVVKKLEIEKEIQTNSFAIEFYNPTSYTIEPFHKAAEVEYQIQADDIINSGQVVFSLDHEIKLSAQDVNDIMVTALEGGINYWCGSARPKDNDYKLSGEDDEGLASDVLTKGGALILIDVEDEEEKNTLTLAKFLKGFQMFLKENNITIDRDGTIDTGEIDANWADNIIQYAVFGEIVFG